MSTREPSSRDCRSAPARVRAGALDDAVGVLYGDSYLRFDLAGAFDRFRSDGRGILMCVLRNEGR